MLIGVFKSNQKTVNALTVLLTAILWLPAFFLDLGTDSPNLVSTNIRWIDLSISIVLIIAQAIYLNYIVSEYKLIKENAHLTSLMFVLYSSCCLFLLNLNQVIIANAFTLVAFHQLIRMYNLKNNYATLFNASFVIAIASLIYFPSIVYFVLLWVALVYTTTPKWRDFIISLLGLSVPFVYFITYKIIIGSFSDIDVGEYMIVLFDIKWNEFTLFNQLFLVIFSAVFLLALMNLFVTINKSVVRTKKMLIIVLLMFILGLGTLILNSFDYFATFLMASIPLSIIAANFFYNIKKPWFAELLFLSLLLGAALSYFS